MPVGNRVGGWRDCSPASAPLTPPYVRVSYTAVRQTSAEQLFSPALPCHLHITVGCCLLTRSISDTFALYNIRRLTFCPSACYFPVGQTRITQFARAPQFASFVTIGTVTAVASSPTMTSADFSAHRKRIYSETSPGKSTCPVSIPVASTYCQSTAFGLRCDVPSHPQQYASYAPCRKCHFRNTCSSVQTHTSGLLQTNPHGQRPCLWLKPPTV